MPDTNTKADQLKALGLTPKQIEALTGIVDNPETESLAPFIAEIKVNSNAKAKLVFPERVVRACGGNDQFQQPTGLDSLQAVNGRANDPGKTVTTPEFDYQNPESFVSGESLRPRGGNVIYIPTQPYPWGKKTNNKEVTFHYPSWMTIVAIQWAFFHCIKDNKKKPVGFYRPGRRRLYLIQDVEDQLKEVAFAD